MKKETMGSGAAMGIHPSSAKKAYAWLWHSWLEAQNAIPSLRWLCLAALVSAGTAFTLAEAEAQSRLDAVVYGMVVLLFVAAIPAIFYLLFEVYRKHRSDAIFDSKRLAHLIERIARQEIEAHAEAELARENTLLLLHPAKPAKSR